MNKALFVNSFSFSQILELFVTSFSKEYGEKLSRKIIDKVSKSDKVNKFLSEAKYRKIKPGIPDFLIVIQSSRHFVFAKSETTCFAATTLLFKWHSEVGQDLGISEDHYLNSIFWGFLEKCNNYKIHTSGTPNFFDSFYALLDEFYIDHKIEFEQNNLPYKMMPRDLSNHLIGLSINQALAGSIIDDVGDEKGTFYFNYIQGNYEGHYAIVQGFAIRVSPKLADFLGKFENQEGADEIIGNCIFFKSRLDDFFLILPEENEDNGWE